MSFNTQIDAYRQPRVPKFHEKQLLDLIAARQPELRGRVLDIGCATGAFIELLHQRFSEAHYTGFDLSPELIEAASRRLEGTACELTVAGALNFAPTGSYDAIIASGVLSIFENFQQPLERWLSWLAPQGILYVFGRFNTRDIDTIVKFRNNRVGSEWEGGLTLYSVHSIGRFLTAAGYRFEFIRFRLPIVLAESDDPIRTYTRTTTDGDTLVLNGANVVAEHHFLVVHR